MLGILGYEVTPRRLALKLASSIQVMLDFENSTINFG